jgi:hypothetical protein
MMLIRFPGEPAMLFLIQSLFILGAVLTEAGVVDSAASIGETAGLTLSVPEGLISGVSTGGVEATEVDELLLSPLLGMVLVLSLLALPLLTLLCDYGSARYLSGDGEVMWTGRYSRELSSCLLCHGRGDAATFSSMLPVLFGG